MDDENVPPRVLAAEKRRIDRERIESLRTPEIAAVFKIGNWELHVPGAPQPTAEDYELFENHMKKLSDKRKHSRRSDR